MSEGSPGLGERSLARRNRAQALRSEEFATRSQRLAARQRSEKIPVFADMAKLPDWMLMDADISQLARVAALVQLRPLIDKEISGQKLAGLAAEVGEGCFDRICAASIPVEPFLSTRTPLLPRPDQLESLGEQLLNNSRPGPGQDGAALNIANLAARLIGEGSQA